MIKITLEDINQKSPYEISLNNGDFDFTTDSGTRICDTSDGREAKRNRLFVRWFEEFATPDRFIMETANATVEGQGFYAAIIVERTNPLLEAIVCDFKQTAESLTDGKP